MVAVVLGGKARLLEGEFVPVADTLHCAMLANVGVVEARGPWISKEEHAAHLVIDVGAAHLVSETILIDQARELREPTAGYYRDEGFHVAVAARAGSFFVAFEAQKGVNWVSGSARVQHASS